MAPQGLGDDLRRLGRLARWKTQPSLPKKKGVLVELLKAFLRNVDQKIFNGKNWHFSKKGGFCLGFSCRGMDPLFLRGSWTNKDLHVWLVEGFTVQDFQHQLYYKMDTWSVSRCPHVRRCEFRIIATARKEFGICAGFPKVFLLRVVMYLVVNW